MKYVIILFLLAFTVSCAQEKQKLKGETEWQKEQNADFKDATKSPLKDKDRKIFDGLDFYKFDSTYAVKAILTRTPDSEWFNMKTTKDLVSKERIFGVLNFEINKRKYQLNVYQGEELMQTEGYEDYLFLPFLDNTNGETTYAGGRYIDLRIPDGDTITLDFNSAYNPYCAYNEKYSCPIVPRINYLDLEVKAGVKAFKKY